METALFYRDGLAALYPGGFQKLHGFAQECVKFDWFSRLFFNGSLDSNKILGFHQLDPNSIDLSAFATSLIITREDFANYQHRDNDIVDLAYGLWWAASWDETTKRYVLSEDCDHDKIPGGSFLFSNYGYGVRFEKFVQSYFFGQSF